MAIAYRPTSSEELTLKSLQSVARSRLAEMGILIDRWKTLDGPQEQSKVWIGYSHQAPCVVAKTHHHVPNAQREILAYQTFRKHLGPWMTEFLGWVDAPRPIILLRFVPTENRHDELGRSQWSELGRCLKTLHEIPYSDEDDIPLHEAVLLRLNAARLEVGSGILTRTQERIVSLLSQGQANTRVFCHRDFHHRNWLWEAPRNTLKLIDFGQNRPDARAIDWVHLLSGWADNVDHYEAFFSAYGHLPEADEWAFALGMCGLFALGSIAWGQKHQERRALDDGRRLIDWLTQHPFDDRIRR